MRCGALRIDFVGDIHDLGASQIFTFGRNGDLQLDTSPELPSVVGVFMHDSGIWWLQNQTQSVDMQLLDRATRSAVLIAAGSKGPIPYEASVLRLVIGPSTYELSLSCRESHDAPTTTAVLGGRPTLNAEQRLLLTALAEDQLRGLDRQELPSNAEVAERLGWRITKLNRKLDHLCIKFDKLGVPGLRGSARRLATERRRHLVDHCLATKLITVEDLLQLPAIDTGDGCSGPSARAS